MSRFIAFVVSPSYWWLPFWVATFTWIFCYNEVLAQSYSTDSSVTLTIPTQQRITNVDDLSFNFSSYSGTGAFSTDDLVCIYNNTANGHYDIMVKGNGAGDAFTVTDGTHTMPYTVYWQDNLAAPSSSTAFTGPSVLLSGRSGASSTQNCGSSTNAAFKVEFAHNDMMKVPAGHYTGKLYIMLLSPTS